MVRQLRIVMVAVGLALPGVGWAQTPAKTPAPAPAKGAQTTAPAKGQPASPAKPAEEPAPAPGSTQTTAPSQLPAPPANFEYRPDGRRDPFISLINRGTDARSRPGQKTVVRTGTGLAALTTDEVAVRGILQNRGAWFAMVTGPGGKTLMVKAGDRLADGVIREITPQAIIILQEVNDPLSLEKQREVRKFLRGGENK